LPGGGGRAGIIFIIQKKLFLEQVSFAESEARGVSMLYISIDQHLVVLPCGIHEGPAFLEELWRQTGADVPGETAVFACSCGERHTVTLTERQILPCLPEGVPPPSTRCEPEPDPQM